MKTIQQKEAAPITVRRADVHVLINQEKECIVFEGGTLMSLGLHLISMAQPEPEIKLTDERREQFKRDALREYSRSGAGSVYEIFEAMYQRLSAEKHFAIERANLALFELTQEYTRKIEDLNERIEELTKQSK